MKGSECILTNMEESVSQEAEKETASSQQKSKNVSPPWSDKLTTIGQKVTGVRGN